MKPLAEHTNQGRRTWLLGATLGGAALLAAARLCHVTPSEPRSSLIAASRETREAVTADPASRFARPAAALATATPAAPQGEAQAPTTPANALVNTMPESTQVEPLAEEHPGRKKELDQTPEWKTEKTRAILRVVTDRVARVEQEAAEFERTGDVAAAARQRVLLARLKRQLSTMNDEIVAYSQADPAAMR